MKKSVLEKVRKDRETMSLLELSRKYKLSVGTIYYYAKDVYNKNNDKRKVGERLDKEKIQNDYLNGKSVFDIAKENNCSYSTIYVYLGLKKGRPYTFEKLLQKSQNKILDYKSGMKQSDIARKYGISRQAVSVLIRKHKDKI